MRRLELICVVALLYPAGAAFAQQQVERKGQTAKLKVEEVVSGHLTELNGRYKLRVTEATFEPGGYVGEHHHVGPGIRCVTSGELTYLLPDKTKIYKPGDCFYESGAITHTASNKGNSPTILLNFELLPADWKGRTLISPRSK